jgi:hypothetical protein
LWRFIDVVKNRLGAFWSKLGEPPVSSRIERFAIDRPENMIHNDLQCAYVYYLHGVIGGAFEGHTKLNPCVYIPPFLLFAAMLTWNNIWND